MRAQRITMADVARASGVSVMTVSRVVNHKEGISDDTRMRVRAVIEQLGYRPSNIARGLVTARTGTIGLVVPDNTNPFFSELARGVEDIAYTEGYNVFLCNTEEDQERELAVLRSLEEKRVDGIILCSSRLDEDDFDSALDPQTSVVLVNRLIEHHSSGAVTIADVEGAMLATRHLIARGHTAIGHLSGPVRSYSGRRRADGYRAALEEAGIPFRAEYEQQCMGTVEAGCRAAMDLVERCPKITAVFCFNDLVAIGALQAQARLGRRVPDDMAIVGFDDIPLASLVTPALTTCRVPKYAMGSRAMRLLLDRINGCGPDCANVEIHPDLVIRASAP